MYSGPNSLICIHRRAYLHVIWENKGWGRYYDLKSRCKNTLLMQQHKINHNSSGQHKHLLPDKGLTNMCSNVNNMFENFTFVNETEVRKMISKIPNKTSSLDPLPTWLFKECTDIMSTFIILFPLWIVLSALGASQFPVIFRQVVITSLINKSNRCVDKLSSHHRQDSWTPAVSRFNEHLQSNNLTEEFQSDDKSAHSTETALLRVKNDIASVPWYYTVVKHMRALLIPLTFRARTFDCG